MAPLRTLQIWMGLAALLVAAPAQSWAAGLAQHIYCADGPSGAPRPGALKLAEHELAGSETPDQIRADTASAKVAIAKVDDLRRRLRKGEALAGAYAPAGHYAALAKAATDPLHAELFRRAAMDQFARAHFFAAANRSDWAAGLSDGAASIAFAVVSTRDVCGTDPSNTAWLKAEIDRRGWFRISIDGADADEAAYQLVQHADLDRPFQKHVLEVVAPLVEAHDSSGAKFAYLTDRVAFGDKRPQRYGTQGQCTGPGTWRPFEVEDPDRLDERRAKAGLPPIATYLKGFVRDCP